MEKTAQGFVEVIALIRRLRGPDGCPWDRKQTPRDVKAYLIEELHELLEAIDRDEPALLAEETGDLLFMILFLTNLYEERNAFTLRDALEKVTAKMIHRHPHVFGSVEVSSAEQVKQNWQALKEQEGKKPRRSHLDGIPDNLPALTAAFFLTAKAAETGFDWEHAGKVIEKIREEIAELEAAVAEQNRQNMTDEIGDLLFSVVNLGRHLGIEPEQALRRTNRKFAQRFAYIETELQKRGISLHEAGLEEMDRLWEEAKRRDTQSS